MNINRIQLGRINNNQVFQLGIIDNNQKTKCYNEYKWNSTGYNRQ